MITESLSMEIIGWLGAALVLGAYALLSTRKLISDSYSYHGMNIAGSILLAIYAYYHGAHASVAVNVIWLVIGCIAVIQLLRFMRRRPNP